MTTVGDRVLNISLPKIGEKSLFTKDLEDALRSGIVDFVVHSLKDLPTVLPDGMSIGAVLEREDARDALVLAKQYDGKCFRTLPEGSIIGLFIQYRVSDFVMVQTNFDFISINRNFVVTTNSTIITFISTLKSARYSRQFKYTFS